MNAKPLWKNIAIVAACGLLGFIGVYLMPVLELLPLLLAFIMLGTGQPALAALSAAAACFGAYYASPAGFGYSLAVFVPASIILTIFFRYKKPYRTAASAVALCLAVSRYLSYCLPSIMAGEEAFYQIRTLLEQITQAYVSFGQMMGVQLSEAAPALIADMAPQMTMIAAIAPAMLFGFINVLGCYLLCKKRGVALRPMAPYYEWKLSRDSLIGAAILTAGMIVVRLMSLKYAMAISAAVETIIVCEFAFNGFCYSEFLSVKIMKQSTGRRVLRYILYVLFVPYSIVVLAILGLADGILSLRARFTNMPPNPPQ